MIRITTSWFPVLLPWQKVFLNNKDEIVLSRGSIQKKLSLKNIDKISILPLGWIYFSYKINDLTLTTRDGENFKIYNLTVSAANRVVERTKNSNPKLAVEKMGLETELLINGLFRTRDASDSTRIPPRLSFVILAVIIVTFIFFIIWFTNQ